MGKTKDKGINEVNASNLIFPKTLIGIGKFKLDHEDFVKIDLVSARNLKAKVNNEAKKKAKLYK
jgi:hypothetical protein